MEIILQEDVENLGEIGDIVKVKDGYARNYLLPRGLALTASRRNVRVLEHQKRLAAKKREHAQQNANVVSDRLSGLTLSITARAGEEDKLFGSVTNIDIEKALHEQGVTIDRRKIILAEPIKQLGTYTIPIRLSRDIEASVTVQVRPESVA